MSIDIESQASSQVSDDKLKKVPLGFIIPPERIPGFVERYGVEPISQAYTNDALAINYHPFLAFERNHLERKVLRYFRKQNYTVMDVGSSPARVMRSNEKYVRCLVPILQPGDDRRRRGYENNPRVCYHTFQQYLHNVSYEHMNHCHNCLPVDALMFVHSAYYIPPECYLHAFKLGVKEIHVVGLLFPEISGSFAPFSSVRSGVTNEASYTYDQELITMRVHGNSHTYSHKKLPWDGFSSFLVNQRTISVTLIEKLGDTCWWRLDLEPETVLTVNPTDDREWESILLDEDHRGPIQVPDVVTKTAQSLVRLTSVSFRVDRLVGDGKNLIVWGSDEIALTIPRGAVAHVANNVVYRERTPALLQSATYYAKGYITLSKLPIERQPHAIAAVAILGISINVTTEAKLINHAINHQSAWWKTHSQLLGFAPIKVFSIYSVAIVAIGLVGIDITTDHFIKTPNHLIALIGMLVIVCCLFFILLLYRYQLYVHEQTTKGWVNELKQKQRASYTDVSTYVPPPLTLPPNTNFKPPAPKEATTEVTVKPDPRPPRNPGNVSERLHLEGISASDVVPSVVLGNQASELAGIMGRMAIETPPVTKLGRDMMESALSSVEFRILREGPNKIKIKDDDKRFNVWLARDAIPSALKKTYKELREVVNAQGITSRDADMTSFVKVEKRLDTTLDGREPVTPRMISNPSDIHKVATGSFLWHFSNALCKAWDGTKFSSGPEFPAGPVYTRGMTAEAIGRMVEKRLGGELFQDLIVLENDGEKFDAHIKDVCTELINDIYREAGANDKTLQAFSVERTRTVTRHGVKMRSKKKILFSGTNETNVKGSLVNAMIHIGFFNRIAITMVRYLMLILGDDNTTFFSDDALPSVSSIIETFKEMGFTMTPLIRRKLWEVEFCNKIFLPCSGGLVLSPKPGRNITKLSWSISQQANLKGTCISMRMDSSHVPFLRVYLKRTMELIDPSTVAKFDKNIEHQFHVKKAYEPTNQTWEFFYQRYGLREEDEKLFEKELLQVTQLPAVINSPYIQILIEIDSGKKPVRSQV